MRNGDYCRDCRTRHGSWAYAHPAGDYCREHNGYRNTSYEAADGSFPWCDIATDAPAVFRYDMEPCRFVSEGGTR